jgi:hypothetical protein
MKRYAIFSALAVFCSELKYVVFGQLDSKRQLDLKEESPWQIISSRIFETQ